MLIGYCYDSYICHGEFRIMQECYNFINVRKIDWQVDFICVVRLAFLVTKLGSPAAKNGSPGESG